MNIKRIQLLFFLSFILFGFKIGVCQSVKHLFSEFPKWQILYGITDHQYIYLYGSPDSYSYYEETLLDKYGITDSLYRDYLYVSKNYLFRRAYTYFDLQGKIDKRVNIDFYKKVCFIEIIRIREENYLIFIYNDQIVAFYQISEILSYPDSIDIDKVPIPIIKLKRIIDFHSGLHDLD